MAMTWKRTWCWSPSSRIEALDLGPMTSAERASTLQTTQRSRGRDGKVKWSGTKALKATQHLDATKDF